MTAKKFILRPYAARQAEHEKQRARYLRKLSPVVLCRTCYGLPHLVKDCTACRK